ncbi:hypothetical protein J1N35_043706 [Gossypium stocksii]|uniref:Uncharacterized protein n=1 Tax=Gossypium stocksii TaxID=47602 RepID=A0A9D3U7W2_9ROSI|nr:hypothetical protein J1N35_043706 [Gossypium stocksii]
MHPEKGFTLKESNYRDFMARIRQVAEALNWELFCEKRPSVDEELVHEFYANLTSSELTEVPVHGIKVLSGLCQSKESALVEKNIWHHLRRYESEDPEEEDDDPTEIESEQSAKVPDEAEPMEPEAEPDIETSMFGAPPPSPDL